MSLNIVTLVVQCKQMDSYGLLLFSYVNDVYNSVFDVLGDGQVECTLNGTLSVTGLTSLFFL